MENKKITDVKVFNKDGQIYVSYTINSIKGTFHKEEPLYDKNGNINMHAQNILEVAKKLEKTPSNNKRELIKHENTNNKEKIDCVRKSNDNKLTIYQPMRKHKNNNLDVYKSKNNSAVKFNTKPSNDFNLNLNYMNLSNVFVARPYMIIDPKNLDKLSYSRQFFLVRPILKKTGILKKEEIIGYEEIITQKQIIKKVKLKKNLHLGNEYEIIDRETRYVNIDTYYNKHMHMDDFLENNRGNLVWKIYDKLPAQNFFTKQEIEAYLNYSCEAMNNKIVSVQQKSYQECNDSYKHYILNKKFIKNYPTKSFSLNF